MPQRLAFLAGSVEELIEKLKACVGGAASVDGIHRGRATGHKDDVGLSLMGQDDDIKASVVRKLIAGSKWSKLLELWVNGVDLDWSTLHDDGGLAASGAQRLSLPTYPFARERHWIDTTTKARQTAVADATGRTRPSPDATPIAVERPAAPTKEASRHLFFREDWRPLTALEPGSVLHRKRTVVFADASLEKTLAADAGHFADAVIVQQGERYEQVSERLHRCRLDDPAGIQDVLARIATVPGEAIDIVYAWSRNREKAGIHSLFQLFKAIKASPHPVSHVTLVGEYDPARAATCWDYSWIGFERSLKLYLARTQICLLYSDTGSVTTPQLLDASRLAGALWYRGGERLALSYRAVEPGADAHGPVLKHGGGYLITGGCGALGMKFAQHLAERYRARLLLVGRRPMSPDIQRQLEALERSGAQAAQYCAVDFADAAAMAAWAQHLPFALSGVIHAAGVESGQPFFERSALDIDQVLDPKTVGTLVLDEVLGHQPLDFVCYFSSSSAWVGDVGSCDYAVANRFLMAHGIHRQRKEGRKGKTVVIHWPLWQDGGMGIADREQTERYLKRTGLEALGTSDGLEIWHRLMGAEHAQILLMAGQPSRIERLLDKVYRVAPTDAATTPSAVGEDGQFDKFISVVKAQANAWSRNDKSTNLSGHQMEKLRQMVKADLLRIQGAGK